MITDQFLEIIKTLVTKLEVGTDLLISELSRYYLVSGLVKLALVTSVSGFLLKLLSSGVKVINLAETQDRVDLVYKGVLKLLSVGVIVGAILFSYQDLQLLIKVGTAPHVFFIEMAKGLLVK